MRKILMVLIVLSAIIGNVTADGPTATLNPSETTTSATASVGMNLDLTTSGTFDRVIIGFSNNPVTGFDSLVENGVKSYMLAKGENGIATNPETPLYVFYQIQSAQKLNVSLYASGPLSNGEETPDTIGFSVVGEKATVGEVSNNTEGVTFINTISPANIGNGSPASDIFVYQHKPSYKVGEAGSYRLEITTENYLTHAMDSYSADLIVQVVAAGN